MVICRKPAALRREGAFARDPAFARDRAGQRSGPGHGAGRPSTIGPQVVHISSTLVLRQSVMLWPPPRRHHQMLWFSA